MSCPFQRVPRPAIRTPSLSIMAGAINPNSLIEAAIFLIWSLEWVRAFRGLAVNSEIGFRTYSSFVDIVAPCFAIYNTEKWKIKLFFCRLDVGVFLD